MTSRPRPAHLTSENAAAFQLTGVVADYHLRTPYPAALGGFLRDLMMPSGGTAIDLGCGTGELARIIARYAKRVDAVDVSAPMLERARAMTTAESNPIRWIHSRSEEVDLDGPYALAIAGDSLHWMNWEIVLPRLAHALAPNAPLAVITAAVETPWSAALGEVIPKYSVIKDFTRFVLAEELDARGLLRVVGTTTVRPEPFERTVDQYVDALHATAGLARDRMAPSDVPAFDEAVRRLVQPFAQEGVLRLMASAEVAWGIPLA